jgi:hypothetical protein
LQSRLASRLTNIERQFEKFGVTHGIERMKENELTTLLMKQLPTLLPPDFTLEEAEREISALEAWKQVYPTYEQQRCFLYSYEQGYDNVLASIIRKRGELPPFAFGFFTGASFIAPHRH